MVKYLVVTKQSKVFLTIVGPYFTAWSDAARWLLANGHRATCVVRKVNSYEIS